MQESNRIKNIEADVIILGCSLPGVVAAHKLRKTFGDEMDIVVLDLGHSRYMSKCNVSFQNDPSTRESISKDPKAKFDNLARHYLFTYAEEFNIPLPQMIIASKTDNIESDALNKVFQYKNGKVVQCRRNYHDFDFLSGVHRFELNQYQNLLDQCIFDLFQENISSTQSERDKLLYYDKTTMEQHICDCLFFPTSKEIMRNTVKLVCGVSPNSVSVLFYLHQCYRTGSCRNHLDGDNARLREKLFGYCRKRLFNKLQQSINDITVPATSITGIRSYSNEQVILETIKGETSYVCNLLAMALRPDQLLKIQVERELLSETEMAIFKEMKAGRAKKIFIQYETNFWRMSGYSGDILSIQGPIIWAMERPTFSTTGSSEKYYSLVGYLMFRDNDNKDSKQAALEQLVKLFGEKAATPVSYRETDIADIFVPHCGDFVALRKWTGRSRTKKLEWGALDIFADGDITAALEAGHRAYVHLLSILRPQATTYEDISTTEWQTILCKDPLKKWLSQINYVRAIRLIVYATLSWASFKVFKAYLRK